MKDGGLPTRTGLEHPEDESNQPGIEGAPVRVDGVCEVTAKVSAGDIQIRVPIPADRETERQRLQKPRRNRGGPHRDSDKPSTPHRFSRFNRDFRFDLPDERSDPEFPFLISKTERWHTLLSCSPLRSILFPRGFCFAQTQKKIEMTSRGASHVLKQCLPLAKQLWHESGHVS